MSMLIHVYPHKPLIKIEVTICNQSTEMQLFTLEDFPLFTVSRKWVIPYLHLCLLSGSKDHDLKYCT